MAIAFCQRSSACRSTNAFIGHIINHVSNSLAVGFLNAFKKKLQRLAVCTPHSIRSFLPTFTSQFHWVAFCVCGF